MHHDICIAPAARLSKSCDSKTKSVLSGSCSHDFAMHEHFSQQAYGAQRFSEASRSVQWALGRETLSHIGLHSPSVPDGTRSSFARPFCQPVSKHVLRHLSKKRTSWLLKSHFHLGPSAVQTGEGRTALRHALVKTRPGSLVLDPVRAEANAQT